uniref:Uncharacterized protein n=1 Tax=Aegilops tauschii subsp. strangulata TaxID=200361 RepID=A0A453HCU5_AEGTS
HTRFAFYFLDSPVHVTLSSPLPPTRFAPLLFPAGALRRASPAVSGRQAVRIAAEDRARGVAGSYCGSYSIPHTRSSSPVRALLNPRSLARTSPSLR